MKKVVVRLAILVAVLGGAIYGGWRLYQAMPNRQSQIATTRVRRGDVVVRSYTRGELRAVRSTTLVAPNLFGSVQVTRLAPIGSFAREKDLIVEFDDSEVNSRLEEKQLEIDQVDEQIKKAQADLAIRNNQDQVELLRARYAVRRAELEVKRNELLSAIDAKRNQLNLEEARRRLKQLESDVKSRLEQAQAEMAVLTERKNKANLELSRERQRLSQVKLLSPMAGLVSIRQNSSGRFFFSGMQVPDIREGDQVQPGMAVADILDVSELELVAKVGEIDRANLKEGQDVNIRLDAVGDQTFHGKIKGMSGTASANVFSSDPAKKFDVIFSVDMKELLSGLGAKPDQIQRMLATAEANRKKPPMPGGGMMMMAGGPGMMAGGGGQGGQGGGPGGQMVMIAGGPGMPGAEGGQGRGERRQFGGGGAGGGGFQQMSEADRQKFRDAMQKALKGRNMQDLSQEERQKVMEDVRKVMGSAMPARPAGGQGGERRAGAPGADQPKPPEGGMALFTRGGQPGAGGAGGERRGGGGGGRGPGGPPGMGFGGAGSQFSLKDLENAKLPLPAEEDNQLEVLIRPGLLADVEIILEKVPNAINIPAQAVFEKDGKQIAYVKSGNKFEQRIIKPLKRTESTMIVESGLRVGELIAMSDPHEKPGAKKAADKPAGGAGGGALGGLPGGGRGGNR